MLNPRTMDRAKRICCAAQLLRTGTTPSEARQIIRARYKVSDSTAWFVVAMACDMVLRP